MQMINLSFVQTAMPILKTKMIKSGAPYIKKRTSGRKA